MKAAIFILVFTVALVSSCLNNQWEDRVASGDTGSVTHGDPTPEKPYSSDSIYYGNCAVNTITHSISGRRLFDAQCRDCHTKDDEKGNYRIGLYRVRSRIPDTTRLYSFIRNEKSLVLKGDVYVSGLRKEFPEYDHYYHKFDITSREIELILGK
jgi:hypothetical protein